MSSAVEEIRECVANGHEFMSPVVIRYVAKSTTFIVGSDILEKEVAVSVCRKCGTRVAYGWGIKLDAGHDEVFE